MRAWQLHELGEPIDRLTLTEVDPPTPRPDQVLLDIDAVGLSFPNVLMCRGEYQVKTTFPYTPGGESAGTVAAVGDQVEGIEVGQRVMAMGGGLEEQAVVNASSVWPVPDNLASPKAAAIPVNYGTTWFALHDRARLRDGETLLVTGAAGGVGSAAIQLGKAAGATVIAVAGGAEKVGHCRALGADHVIDHHVNEDFVDEVRDVSGGGVDVAYDPVGGDVLHRVRRCMAWDGRLLIIGFVQGIPELPANHILLKNYSVVGVHWGASLGRDPGSLDHQMRSVLELAATGHVDPLLYPPFPFDEGARALQALADRETYGKAVVTGTGVAPAEGAQQPLNNNTL
ncbi:MAG: NADPH:quinone oxidoreductase family protein [Acidimicrobiia bacterium]|nr:NADPH:quinone oxidoreductase family protein [Acidimicrobiia bacterium]